MLSEWGGKIYIALSNGKIYLKDCDTHKFIICNQYPSGYEDLYSLISANYPNNLTHPIYIISAPPIQLKVGDPLSKYFHRYKYYLELRAYLKNYSATLYYPDELDTFILGVNNCFKFSRRSHEKRHSKEKK